MDTGRQDMLTLSPDTSLFAQRILLWQKRHGRHDLPWQINRTPYTVWLSEIMLQQTQVATVRDYYARFLQSFPTLVDLARASQDEVLSLWSGLGYYSRARNLHRCAQVVVNDHGGRFPTLAAELVKLPGIGPSTAAAIASICFGECVAIFDGNVERVLARYTAFTGDLSRSTQKKSLYAIAQSVLPSGRSASQKMPCYTQAVMDLGALICRRSNPLCSACPLSASCVARHQGNPEHFPVKTKSLRRRREDLWMLWCEDESGHVLLNRQPVSGVWANLFSFPIISTPEAWNETIHAFTDTEDEPIRCHKLSPLLHVLTHKDLMLHIVHCVGKRTHFHALKGRWFDSVELQGVGLPGPLKKLGLYPATL